MTWFPKCLAPSVADDQEERGLIEPDPMKLQLQLHRGAALEHGRVHTNSKGGIDHARAGRPCTWGGATDRDKEREALKNFEKHAFSGHVLDDAWAARQGGAGWGRAHTFALEGLYGGPNTGEGELQHPRAVAVFPDGGFCVTDAGQRRVALYSSQGRFVRAIGGTEGRWKKDFMYPYGVCVDGGLIYVTDHENNRVVVYTRGGEFVRSFGTKGAAPGKLDSPTGIAACGGEVYVCDEGNRRVQVFDAHGSFLRGLGAGGNGDGEFGSIKAITVSPLDGKIVTVDVDEGGGGGRVQLFSRKGRFLRRVGDGLVLNPVDVSVSAGGDIVVADSEPTGIHIFGPNGAPLQEVEGVRGKFAPRGVCVGPDGRIFAPHLHTSCVRVFYPVPRG